MNVRSVKFEENTNIGYVIFTTSCKRDSTAISRFEKALSDYDSCFTESMLKAFMSIKPCGYVDGSLAWSGSSVINEEYEMHITYLDGTYSLTIYFLPALLKKDTTEDTKDTTEDKTEDTKDTTEDKTEDTKDTTEDKTEDTKDTTDSFQIVPLLVYSKYNINPLTSLIYALVKFLDRKEMYISPCLYRMIDDIIIIDDTFLTDELPF